MAPTGSSANLLREKIARAAKLVTDLEVHVSDRGDVVIEWASEYAPRGASVTGKSYSLALDRLLAEEDRRRQSGCTTERSSCGD